MAKTNHTHERKITKDAYVIDVNMGYGHSRPAHCLTDISGGRVISANDYPGIPEKDKKMWSDSRRAYETISRLKPIPVIGDVAFGAMDRIQKIHSFYPRRDLSRPNLQLLQIYQWLKKGLGEHLIKKLSQDPKPIVTTFFVPAFFAEYNDYPGDIYCITTDADISRTWAPLHPKKSRIKYIASNGRVKERLQLYGVKESQIYLTGFPLPKELVGGYPDEKLRQMLHDRMCNLDPQGIFHNRYRELLKAKFGDEACRVHKIKRPLTLLYMLGGAGAQRQLALDIMKSLKTKIKRHEIRFYLVPGTRNDVAEMFTQEAKAMGLKQELGKWLVIPTFPSRAAYFKGFNKLLMQTDIIWTKPSEMSFYTALGFPIIMSEPIGSQEKFNRVWLRYLGGGMSMENPKATNEWLFDWINSGGLARMAWSGYIEAPTHGTYRIEDLVLGRPSEIHPLPLIV